MDKFVVQKDESLNFFYKEKVFSDFVVEENGVLDFVYVGDSNFSDVNLDFLLFKGASLRFNGVVVGKGDDDFVLNINVVHRGKDSKSDVVIRSALFGSAKLKAYGNVFVDKGSDFSETSLILSGVMLGDDARFDVTPALEIIPNEVKASHKTALGKIDEEVLFYLLSRGISRDEATKLIVEGFLCDGFDEGIRDFILNLL